MGGVCALNRIKRRLKDNGWMVGWIDGLSNVLCPKQSKGDKGYTFEKVMEKVTFLLEKKIRISLFNVIFTILEI